LEVGGAERIAPLEVAGIKTPPEPPHPLRRRAMCERIGHHTPLGLALKSVVADRGGGAERFLEVALSRICRVSWAWCAHTPARQSAWSS
jgi:hypothetical protein